MTFTTIDVPLATSGITNDAAAEAGDPVSRQPAVAHANPAPQPDSGWRYTSEGWRKREDLQFLAGRHQSTPKHLQRIHPLTVSLLQILGVLMVLLLSTDSKRTHDQTTRRVDSSDAPNSIHEHDVDSQA